MGVWNGFLLGKTQRGRCSLPVLWECRWGWSSLLGLPFSPFVQIREHPEFLPLMSCDRSTWPRCLAWHGWLPALSPRRFGSPWAVATTDWVDVALETALGFYPVHPGEVWKPNWDPDDISDLADCVPDHPNIWTDASRDEDLDAMVGVAGAGAYVKEGVMVDSGPLTDANVACWPYSVPMLIRFTSFLVSLFKMFGGFISKCFSMYLLRSDSSYIGLGWKSPMLILLWGYGVLQPKKVWFAFCVQGCWWALSAGRPPLSW